MKKIYFLISLLIIPLLSSEYVFKIKNSEIDFNVDKETIKPFPAESGTYISFPYPPRELAIYKNGDLLIASGSSIYKYNYTNGIVDVMTITGSVFGVYYDFEEEHLIVSDNSNKKYHVYSDFNGELLNSYNSNAERIYTITKVNGNYVTISGGSYAGIVRIHNGTDLSSITSSFDAIGGTDMTHGLASDGNNLFTIDPYRDTILLFNGTTPPYTQSFGTPGSEGYGLVYDGEKLISSDRSSKRIYIHEGKNAWISK